MNIIAQIGCGYWGPNLLRNFSAQPGCHVKWVVEQSPQRRDFVEGNYPKTRAVPDLETAMNDPEVEAVIIATPAATHYALAGEALRAGKHVFVEKPLATRTREADELAALAASAGRTLMVGHTFLYNAAVRYIRQALDRGDLGRIYYIYTQRLNLGQVRSDVNAWWNLAPHDVSILLYLMDGELPVSISAHGVDYLQPGIEDVVFAVLTWNNRVTAHIHVSWLDPGKVRKVTLVGDHKMIVYDDVSDDKITVLDKGVDRVPKAGERMDYDQINTHQLVHRTGDVWLPRIDFQEPLKVEAAHFLECIRTGRTPLTGPQHARDVVAVLEAGQQSLREGGRSVTVIQNLH
ncbi:MAG: Gfo/Idh/MocA family oxidoreductase [Candidatus Latescibacteria bacterium]|nr:Gfo/Idh/MocA family oxidoreductase [Candidatus Latescibacterota bacterium]